MEQEKFDIIKKCIKYNVRNKTDDFAITRPHDYEGIEEYLYFEIDNTTQILTKSLISKWEISEEEAFKIAESNTDRGIIDILAKRLSTKETL